MLRTAAAIVLTVAAAAAGAPAADPLDEARQVARSLADAAKAGLKNPATEAAAAFLYLDDLCRKRPDLVPYVRFGSDYGVDPAERSSFRKANRVWTRHLTLGPSPQPNWVAVPGSDTLFAIDLRSMKWTAPAWRAVALRDFRFREPWVPYAVAGGLRSLIGERRPDGEQSKERSLNAVAIVDLWTLYAQSYDAQEFPTYYDLLFGEQRFVAKSVKRKRKVREFWPGGPDKSGKVFAAGHYEREEEYDEPAGEVEFVNFPRTYREWLSAFDAEKIGDLIDGRARERRVRHGAVCEGSRSNPQQGSYVVYHDRLVWYTPVFNQVLTQTFDVARQAGQRNLYENAFTDEPGDIQRAAFDGGEALIDSPAGDARVGIAFNAKFDVVNEVPPQIARNTKDPESPAVRTGGACQGCHAAEGGILSLRNVIELRQPSRTDVSFADVAKRASGRERAENYQAFFFGWQEYLDGSRRRRLRAWEEMTREPGGAAGSGWTGRQVAEQLIRWKNLYIGRVSLAQLVRDSGHPPRLVRAVLIDLDDSVTKELAANNDVIRDAYDEDVYPRVMAYFSAEAAGDGRRKRVETAAERLK